MELQFFVSIPETLQLLQQAVSFLAALLIRLCGLLESVVGYLEALLQLFSLLLQLCPGFDEL